MSARAWPARNSVADVVNAVRALQAEGFAVSVDSLDAQGTRVEWAAGTSALGTRIR